MYGNILEIKHVECGQLIYGQQSITSVQRKFSVINQNNITTHFQNITGFRGPTVNFEKIYVANSWSKPTLNGVSNLGITVYTLPVFICSKVLPTIESWKRLWINRNSLKTKKTKDITLPESCWLLKLLEELLRSELLDCTDYT